MIVLDDASNDNTSVLIKSFAHAGVRFVEGSALPEGWLGKTHAEHELYEEASGEFILFLDVDTHITPRTIDNLVAIALNEKAEVVSVLPKRDDVFRGSVLFATLRYFWTIILHRKAHPAVASSAWMVRRSLLHDQFNGFEQLRTAVEPERIIAAHATTHSHYRFLISTSELGVSYEKKWRSQLETSTRLLYPFLGGRFVPVTGAYLLILSLLFPFVWIASALFTSWSVYHTVAVVIACLVLSSYMHYVHRVWQRGWLVGGIVFPFVLIQELCLLTASIYAYATHSVTWKGRPVTGTARSITHTITD
jgi:glycosyltransferase involved in cell wall biosynthesis